MRQSLIQILAVSSPHSISLRSRRWLRIGSGESTDPLTCTNSFHPSIPHSLSTQETLSTSIYIFYPSNLLLGDGNGERRKLQRNGLPSQETEINQCFVSSVAALKLQQIAGNIECLWQPASNVNSSNVAYAYIHITIPLQALRITSIGS
jgi:hypothetical protein